MGHDSTRKRMEMIVAEAEALYEPGNQSKCYAAIWRRVIYPKYGIHYYTFMHYINVVKYGDGAKKKKIDDRHMRLFNGEDD